MRAWMVAHPVLAGLSALGVLGTVVVTVVLLASPSRRTAAAKVVRSLIPGDTSVYVVERGDTLGDIARRAGTTLDALRVLNPQIVDVDRIEVGDRVYLRA